MWIDYELALAVAGLIFVMVAIVVWEMRSRSVERVCLVNHVGMFETASSTCNHCRGTGWVPVYPDRSMSRCVCVEDHDEASANR